MNRKRIILLLILTVFLGAALAGGVYLVQQQQLLRPKAAPATALSLSPSDAAPRVGDTFTVDVNIDTGENQVIIAELHLNFNSTLLAAQDITIGWFFTNPSSFGKNIDNAAGTIDFTVFLQPESPPQQGSGIVAVVTFQALSPGSATISFSDNTIVGAVQEGGENVLVSATSTTVTVQEGGGPTSTPTPTEGVGPTSTPTPTPTGSATLTPTPTDGAGGATPTPTPAGGATSTPTPTSSATATPTPTNQGGGVSLTSTPTPTPVPEVPVSGVGLPTILLLAAGAVLLLLGGWWIVLAV